MTNRSEFLVYILVDEDQNIRYVGRGTHPRSMVHGVGDWNPGIAKAYEEGQLQTLVVDCETEQAMEVAEGVLISALLQFKNSLPLANRRYDKFTFKPSRVPDPFSDRLQMPLLNEKVVAEKVGGAVIYVRIREGSIPYENHEDIDPIHPRTSAIANRIQETWAIDPWLQDWRDHPERAPRAIIGLAGSTNNRYVLGALDLRGVEWPQPVGKKSALHRIPWAKLGQTADDSDIDAFELCGRRFEGVTFQSGNWNYTKLYDSNGDPVPRNASPMQ